MKKLLAIVLFLSIGFVAQAQTFSEWFAQKKTQLKYLTDQIAAMQVYAGYLQKGYHIASQGLVTISDIKNGEFSLHNAFFGSLKSINPAIAKDARIVAIIAMQVSIVQRYHKAFSRVQSSGLFTYAQINYVYHVFNSLLNDCSNDLGELISLTTAGEWQLTDKQRLDRLEEIHKSCQDKYAFSQSFSNETNLMAIAKMKDSNDAGTIGRLYNLK